MRFLAWHVDYVKAAPGDAGRSSIREEAKGIYAENALLVFANFEKSDSGKPEIVEKAANEIESIAKQLGVKTIVLNPFAHLFAEPLDLKEAQSMLNALYDLLLNRGYSVQKMAFGIFYSLELKAKGHKLARVARSIS